MAPYVLPPRRTLIAQLRGATQLAVDATLGVADIVERMHRTVQLHPLPLASPPPPGATRGITGWVYRSVKRSIRGVGDGLDAALGLLEHIAADADDAPRWLALQSALNGIYGDHLAGTGNPLVLPMSLRYRGHRINPHAAESSLQVAGAHAPTTKLLVLVHGLCMNDQQWRRDGHDHGAELADAHGYTPLYLRYNSGRRIDDNGAELAALLDDLVRHWPRPVDELVLLGHSMGGLLIRSACLHASMNDYVWPRRRCRLLFLGTPHHGAPLERGGAQIDRALELSPYSAPFARLGRARSVGIQNLRHGTIGTRDAAFVPLPAGFDCFAIAATLGARRSGLVDRLLGDGLVPLDSALGRHPDATRTLAFQRSRQWIAYQTGHVQLLWREEVCARLSRWLGDASTR